MVFHSLDERQLRQILDFLAICASYNSDLALARTKFLFNCSDSANMLLREGMDSRYGARHLKRSI